MDGTRAPTRFSREDADLRRYRRVAEYTLQQLEWCIGYLHAIHKTKEARVLARNRTVIRSRLIRQPAPPLPSEAANPSPGAASARRSSADPRM